MNNIKIYQKILDYFGKKHQITKAIEECAELITILARHTDRYVDKKEIITEIADVQIMIDQLKLIFGEEAINNEIKYKLDKVQLRIKHQI